MDTIKNMFPELYEKYIREAEADPNPRLTREEEEEALARGLPTELPREVKARRMRRIDGPISTPEVTEMTEETILDDILAGTADRVITDESTIDELRAIEEERALLESMRHGKNMVADTALGAALARLRQRR